MLRDPKNWRRLLALVILNVFCRVADTAGAKRPEYFFGFFFGGRLTQENLSKILDHLPPVGDCELMCHPGLRDANNVRAHWGYLWQDELNALTDPRVRQYLNTNGIELISYANLLPS